MEAATTNKLRPVQINDRYRYKKPKKKKEHNYKGAVKYIIGTIIVVVLTLCIIKVGTDTVQKINETQATIQDNFSKKGYKIFEDSAERHMAMIATIPFLESSSDDLCQYLYNNQLHSCRYFVNKTNKTVSLYASGMVGSSPAILTIDYER